MKRAKKDVSVEFLVEAGILKDPRALDIKENLVWELKRAMANENMTKGEMAKRMESSRATLDRLLDPGNVSVTLDTLLRAAKAVGLKLRVEVV